MEFLEESERPTRNKDQERKDSKTKRSIQGSILQPLYLSLCPMVVADSKHARRVRRAGVGHGGESGREK
jgi:hypothetical protein